MGTANEEVTVAGTGDVWIADVGTDFPADIDTPVDEGDWFKLGYVAENGVELTIGRTTKDINAWNADDPIRIIQRGKPKSAKFTMQQLNSETLLLAAGGGTYEDGVYTEDEDTPAPEKAYIFEARDGDETVRFMFARGQITDDVSFKLVSEDPINFPVTVRFLKADEGPSLTVQGVDEPTNEET